MTTDATAVDFDRTGQYLVVGDDQGAVHLFEVNATGTKLTPLDSSCKVDFTANPRDVGPPTIALDVSPTTDVLAIARDDAVQLCDLSDPVDRGVTRLGRTVQLPDRAFDMSFAGSGDRLATGGADQQVTIWSVSPEEKVPLEKTPSSILQSNSITALAFSPDSSVLAVGDGDGSACLWDVEVLRVVGSCLTGHYGIDAAMDALAFTPDGRSLVTGGRLNPAVVWDSVLWADPEIDDGAASRQLDLMCQLAGKKNLTQEQWDIAFKGTSIADDRHDTCPS